MAHLALCWHMHQPYYGSLEERRNPTSIILFRTLQNYYPMASLVQAHPGIKINFNLTPVLVRQILEISRGESTDAFSDLLTEKELNPHQIEFFLKEFPERITQKYPVLGLLEEKIRQNQFSTQDLLDLAVWLHLICFHPLLVDEQLESLLKKGRDFSPEDRSHLLKKEQEILAATLPLYKSLWASGQAEISTSPYYHPILPLVLDSHTARKTKTSLSIPEEAYAFPEDAEEQIRRAISLHAEVFGRPASGVWPSEGGLSEETLELLASAGISWTATDEALLLDTLKESDRSCLYRKYLFREKIAVFFRDHFLSDLIGFRYQGRKEIEAGRDFFSRLKEIDHCCPEAVITIILDGENPWDWYPNAGLEFLTTLYELLQDSREIKTATFREICDLAGPAGRIQNLAPGTWMGLNFDNWIGKEPANKAWLMLKNGRTAAEQAKPHVPTDTYRLVQEYLYLTEGSDWFWWYSLPASPEIKSRFDSLFRNSLTRIYELLKLEIPAELLKPVESLLSEEQAAAYIKPVLDGRITNYFEWHNAVELDPANLWLTIKPVSLPIRKLFYGYDKDNFYLRLDFIEKFSGQINLNFRTRISTTLVLDTKATENQGFSWALADILEISIPRIRFQETPKEKTYLNLQVFFATGAEIRLPPAGYLELTFREEEDWGI